MQCDKQKLDMQLRKLATENGTPDTEFAITKHAHEHDGVGSVDFHNSIFNLYMRSNIALFWAFILFFAGIAESYTNYTQWPK